VALGYLTNGTPLDKFCNIFEHVGPKVVVFGHDVCLAFSKVTGKRSSMNFSKNEFTGTPPWYRKMISLE